MVVTAGEVMAAIDAAIHAWDDAKPACVVETASVGGGVEWAASKAVRLVKDYGGGRDGTVLVTFLADDYRAAPDVGAAVAAELDRHELALDDLVDRRAER